MARVLVVDDENLMRTMVEVACRRLGHEALCAATLAEGRRLAAAGVDVILLDMLLPDGNGLDAQQELAALPDAPDIVVITGHGDGDAAEKALRGGVWDFLMKPVRVRDVEETLSHVLEARDRRRSRRGLELEPGQVAGSGPAMQAALAQLEQAAHSDVNVLLLGETGVGKDVFARLTHRWSRRKDKILLKVDCGGISETLTESEIFGYVPGAFTGASSKGKPGYFEIADGSTIFLDEVGELPLSMQTRLLRVLQDNEIVRVGSSQPRKVDVRIIAATNRNLEECVEAGTFRRDLFYRLNVGTVRIPPLRERPEDVRVLAELFLRQYTTKYRKKLAFMDITLDMLAQYRWPGNVRELQNLVHSLVITRQGPRISPRDLPSNISGLHDESGGHLDAVLMQARPLREIIADMERDFLRRAIEVHGSVRRVSELFQVNRSTIFRKLQGSKGHDKDEDGGSAS